VAARSAAFDRRNYCPADDNKHKNFFDFFDVAVKILRSSVPSEKARKFGWFFECGIAGGRRPRPANAQGIGGV
jgi:hypothetical protein